MPIVGLFAEWNSGETHLFSFMCAVGIVATLLSHAALFQTVCRWTATNEPDFEEAMKIAALVDVVTIAIAGGVTFGFLVLAGRADLNFLPILVSLIALPISYPISAIIVARRLDVPFRQGFQICRRFLAVGASVALVIAVVVSAVFLSLNHLAKFTHFEHGGDWKAALGIIVSLPIALALASLLLRFACGLAAVPVPSFARRLVVVGVAGVIQFLVQLVFGIVVVAPARGSTETVHQLLVAAYSIPVNLLATAGVYSRMLNVSFGKGLLIYLYQALISLTIGLGVFLIVFLLMATAPR